MFGSNGHYGHRSILNAYAGVPDRHPVPGLVQHGWNYDLGAALEDILLPSPNPFYVWSSRNLRQCKKAGIGSRVAALGAPFLYMPEPAEAPPPEPRSLLVMPIHGWERGRIQQDFREYAAQLGELARQGEVGKVTVCLYWFDHQFAEYRRPFEALGFSVVTVGARDENPRFLFDLRDLVLRHAYVSSNRAQTAAFYALALGRKFFLYGPPIGLDGKLDHSGQLFHAWQEREFPELLWKGFKDLCYRDLGERELGLEHKRSPEALRELFLWTPARQGVLRAKLDEHRRRERRRARERKIGRFRELAAALLPAAFRPRAE